jgi:hypothetical protein
MCHKETGLCAHHFKRIAVNFKVPYANEQKVQWSQEISQVLNFQLGSTTCICWNRTHS